MNKFLVAERLREAAAAVDKGWARGSFALDRDGGVISATHPEAVCWCAIGALQKVIPRRWDSHSDGELYARCLLAADQEAVITCPTVSGVATYNDMIAEFADDVSSLLRRAAARQVM